MSRRLKTQVNRTFSWSLRHRRRANLVGKGDCEQNAEVMENRPIGKTVAVEKEQLKSDPRSGVAKEERLDLELITKRKLLEDKKGDADYDMACKLKRIKELMESEEQAEGGVRSSESKGEDHYVKSDGDITEHESQYCIADREVNECKWDTDWESVERIEERFSIVGTSSRLPGAAATRGNHEATICEEGAPFFTPVPSTASSKDSSTGGQSVKCPICFSEFGTQEVGTPESCNHGFCVDCLQEWSENSNMCPVGQEVYDASVGREVVRRIHVETGRQQVEDEVTVYMQRCEECGRIGYDEEIIFCVGCGQGCHLECVYPPLVTSPPPLEEWFCSNCSLPSPLYDEYE